MPINALRSVEAHFDRVLRHVMPKRLVAELKVGDKGFYFKYFKGYRPESIGRGRIKQIARREVFEGDGHELFANLMIIHWNEHHAPLYREMVTHVKTINEDVEAIERIEDDKAHAIIDDLAQRHDLEDVLLCVRLNGVRFSEDLIQSRLERKEPAPEAGTGAATETGTETGTEAGAETAAETETGTEAETETKAETKTETETETKTETETETEA
ncbi:MAG: hypothetical protein H6746_12270 [Deltaproteobacteria bacterium]|nr:hypothetical protein [Deltaproteobacteria bacterium]